jgi:hypothetical protein
LETLTVVSEVSSDGVLKIEVPCRLPPGPVEVVLTVRQPANGARPNWDELYGLGREVWAGVDAQEHVRQLREDREPPR